MKVIEFLSISCELNEQNVDIKYFKINGEYYRLLQKGNEGCMREAEIESFTKQEAIDSLTNFLKEAFSFISKSNICRFTTYTRDTDLYKKERFYNSLVFDTDNDFDRFVLNISKDTELLEEAQKFIHPAKPFTEKGDYIIEIKDELEVKEYKYFER